MVDRVATDPTPMRPCPCNGRHRNERGGEESRQRRVISAGSMHARAPNPPTPPVHANSRKCNARGPPALSACIGRGCVMCVCGLHSGSAGDAWLSLSLLCSGLVSSHVRTTPYSSSTCVSVTDGTGPRPDGPAAPPLAPPPTPLPCSACVRIRTDFEALHQKAEATPTASVFLKTFASADAARGLISVCQPVTRARDRCSTPVVGLPLTRLHPMHACLPASLHCIYTMH